MVEMDEKKTMKKKPIIFFSIDERLKTRPKSSRV